METIDADAELGPATFDAFVADAWPRLLRTAHLLTGSPETGADLVQDVLVRMFAGWDAVARLDHPEAYVRAAVWSLARAVVPMVPGPYDRPGQLPPQSFFDGVRAGQTPLGGNDVPETHPLSTRLP